MSDEPTTRKLRGHLYVSGNGQLVIDQHASDVEHLTAQQTNDRQPLYTCRTYLTDVLPKWWVGEHGTLVATPVRDVDGRVRHVLLTFTPTSP